jgi:hypothetical protein
MIDKKLKSTKPLEVKKVPVPPNDHPDPPFPQLMKHEFTVRHIYRLTIVRLNWFHNNNRSSQRCWKDDGDL